MAPILFSISVVIILIYVGTDWHLWKYSKKSGRCIKRPEFDDIIKFAENTVSEDDFILYLGDLTDDEFGSPEKLVGIFNNVKGYKIMVRGNNDTLDDSAYLAAGFDRVVDVVTLGNIIFTHRPVYVGPLQINVHGHNHGKANEFATVQNIDAWGGSDYLLPLEDVICGNEPDFSLSITDRFWTSASPKHEVLSGTIFDLEEYYINGIDNSPVDESVFREDDELEISDLLESIEESTIPKKEKVLNYLRKIKYLTEAFYSEESIGEVVRESLEMLVGKKPSTLKNGMVTLYHASPEALLKRIKAASFNVGTRLSSPRTSSFWADDPAVAIIMGIWKVMTLDNDLYESVVWMLDFKNKKLVVSNKSKSLFIKGMKDKYMSLYVATVPINHVGKGHDPDINEYSVDIDVFPHHESLLQYDEFIPYVRFVSENEFARLMNHGRSVNKKRIAPRDVPFRDKLIYHGNFRTNVSKIQDEMDRGEAIGTATYTPVFEAAYNKTIYDHFFSDGNESSVNEVLLQDFEDAKDFETDDDVSRTHQDPDRQATYRVRFKKKNRENPDVPTVDESVLTESRSVIELSLPLMQPEMEKALADARKEFIQKGLLPSPIEEAARIQARTIRKGEFDKAHRLQKAKKGKDPLAEASPFEGKFKSVKIDEKNSMIVIKGIDFKKLMARLKNMYDTKKVNNLFDIEYTPWSLYLYNSEQIEKSAMKIKNVKVPLFFALELQQIFYDLADYYQLKYYTELGNEIYKKTWISNVDKPVQRNEVNMNKLKSLFTIEPLPYQIGYVQEYFTITRCYNFDGHILTFKPGYGKTFTAVMIAEASKDVDQVVVVCPNTLKENWANELKGYYKKYANNEIKWKEEVFVSNNSKFNFVKSKNKWVIVNQESIPTIFDKVKSKSVMIVVDECQYFRNYETKRSSDLLELKARTNATEVLMMSGTPIHATPDEALTALLMIDPMMNLELAGKYKKAFSVDNTSLERVINARFGIIMYDVPTDVLKLPAKHEMELKVKLDNDEKFFLTNVAIKVAESYRKHYSQLGENAGQYRKDFEKILRKYSSATSDENRMYTQFIDDGANYMSVHESKHDFYRTFIKTYIYPNVPQESLKEVKQVVANYAYMSAKARGLAIGEVMPPLYNEVNMRLWADNEDFFIDKIKSNLKKTLIFSPYVGVVNYVADRLKAKGIGTVVITGSVVKNRQDRINEFCHSDMIDVMVATHNVAGTGLTLIEASQVFFFGVPFRSAEYDQAANRVYRIGQTSEVYIYKVLLDSSVDKVANITTRQNDIMEWSRNMSTAYTKGAKTPMEYTFEEEVLSESAIQRACAQYDEYNLEPFFGKETAENQWNSDYDDAYSDDEVEFDEAVSKSTKKHTFPVDPKFPNGKSMGLVNFSIGAKDYDPRTNMKYTNVKKYSGNIYYAQKTEDSMAFDRSLGIVPATDVVFYYDKISSAICQVFYSRPKSELEEMYCDPPLRGTGVAKKVLKAAIDIFHPKNLEVYSDNYPAIMLYTSLGFAIVGESPENDGVLELKWNPNKAVESREKYFDSLGMLAEASVDPWHHYHDSGAGRNYNHAAVDKRLREIIETREAGIETYLKSINGLIDESLIFSKDCLELNLSNWAPGKNNILYVTGLSGSGKTTYSEELEKAGEGVIFELDGLFLCYDSSNRGIIKRLEREDDDYKYHTPKSKVTRKQFKRWINSVIRYMHEDPETKYIVEGVQVYEYPGPLVDFAHDPVVIIGTSVLKSIYRRIKRAEGSDRRNQLRELRQMVCYYLDEHKKFTHFVKNAIANESWEESMPTDVDGDNAQHIDGTHKDFMMKVDPTIGDIWDEYDDPITETSTLIPVAMSDGVAIKIRPGNTLYYTAEDLRFFVAWLDESYHQLLRMLRTSEVDARAFANIKIIRAWMTKFYILANPSVDPSNKEYAQLIADNTDKLMRSYMERCVDMGISLKYLNDEVEPIFNVKKECLENFDIINLADGEQGILIHI